MGKYGVKSEQEKVLKELEKLIGKSIPKISKSIFSYANSISNPKKPPFGVQIQGDNVVGLLLNPLSSYGKGYKPPLTTLPESIGNLVSLRELKIAYNELTTLPESIGNLQSLQRLEISRNELTTLPESIGNLKSLEILNLQNNKLTTLPESISNLKSLQVLDLRWNKLTTLPESIINLRNLQNFNFYSNQLVGEWAEIWAVTGKDRDRDLSKIFNSIRKLYGMNIFISHAWVDQHRYQILELNRYLEKDVLTHESKFNLNIIHDVYICETDVIDDIWDFMTENVPKSHLLLFIATNNSIVSVACRYELFLANKFNIEILPIKGKDIKWEDLSKIELLDRNNQPQGILDISNPKEKFQYDGVTFIEIHKKLNKYLITHESELKKGKKGIEGFETTKKIILNIINSDEFRDLVKPNIESFEQLYQELSNEQISNSGYYSKLGEIFKS